MSAWWQTEEEPPPQSRIGSAQRPSHQPVQQPVEEAQRVRMPRRAPRSPRFPRPSGVTLFAVIAALLFVAIPALIVISVIDSVDDVDRPGGSGAFDGEADGPSLVRADRFGLALEKIKDRAGPEGSLVAMRLDPDRVSAVVRKADGTRSVIIVARDLDLTELPAGSGGERGLSLNRINPFVPERLVRAAAERRGVKPGALSYMAVSPIPTSRSGGQWSIFFEAPGSNSMVVADLDGRNITVPGQ